MKHSTHEASIHAPSEEVERTLMDAAAWDWDDPVEAIVAENPLAVLPIKVTMDEHRAIAQAARAKDLSTSAFIKQSAVDAAGLTQFEAVTPAKDPRAAADESVQFALAGTNFACG